MAALNFKAEFADEVQAARKTCSIRGRPIKLGETVFLFTGMRTTACRRLGFGAVIGCRPIQLGWNQNGLPLILIDKKVINSEERELLAHQDGFVSSRRMLEWFDATYSKGTKWDDKGSILVFDGHLIYWRMSESRDRLTMTAAEFHRLAAVATASFLGRPI